jgi:hypothetical protein
MEKKSAYLGFIKNLEGQKRMSDVLLARTLLADIGGKGRVSDMIYSAYTKLQKLFPHDDEPHKQWSERRLKAWWNRETENVMHWQMVELFQAAAKAKEERELIEAARREHAEFIQKTTAIAAILERTDQAFHSDQIAALRQQSRGMGRPGNRGD